MKKPVLSPTVKEGDLDPKLCFNNFDVYCTLLYCTVLYCISLYCSVLYYTVFHCTVLHCTVFCIVAIMTCYCCLIERGGRQGAGAAASPHYLSYIKILSLLLVASYIP